MSKYSDWRTDLREVMDDDTDDRKVSDKKVNNAKLIKINPKLGEAVEELGGQIIEMKEVEDEKIEKDADADKKAAMADKVKKKEAMLKKRIVRMKMMAVNQGAADSIVAGYEPEGEVIDEAERSIDDRLERKRKLYKKTTRKAMDYARREGEAAGHARYRMSSISREIDKLAAKKNVKEGVMKFIKSVGKKPEKKAEKATDAGARARRKLQQKDHEKVNFLPIDEGKGYQPEIEVIKSKDLKKKERESKLPPHLQGDAIGKMKKAFASAKNESYEINPSAHKAAQKKTKMRNLAIGNENPNEKAAAEKKAGGPKLVGEGVMKMIKTIGRKKKAERKPQKATDAGAVARRKLQQKDHETVNFLPMNESDKPEKDINKINEKKRKNALQIQKVIGEDKGFDYVLAKLKAKHGDGVLTKGDKIKSPSAAQKKKNAEIMAKRAKQDGRDATEKASDGRYNDRSRSD